MYVRFWGTRGSIPAPGHQTSRYGGNTSCVEVRPGDDTVIILDCGTGARELGLQLLRRTAQPLRLYLFIGHTHWDHIQGFPFFVPAFLPDTELNIYAPVGFQRSLEEAMSGQMQYSYFPVKLHDLRSRIHFTELEEGFFRVGDVQVETQYLNHTAPTIAYRISSGGTSLVYATDHEPFWRPAGLHFHHPGDQHHIAFLKGADLVIHDAQYSEEEYHTKVGWGHSPIEYATDVALAAGVGRLALFHHDPTHDDAVMEQLEARARARVARRAGAVDVFAAAEGLELGGAGPRARSGRGGGIGPAASADRGDGAPAMPGLVTLLEAVPLFRTLTREQLSALAQQASEQLYPPGHVVIRQGEPGSQLFVLLSGRVRVVETAPDLPQAELFLEELGTGEVFGELSALREQPRSATVMAVEPTRCLILSQNAFLQALRSSSDLAIALLQVLAGRLAHADRLLARYSPDPLTGLASRRAFHDQYRRLAAGARRRRSGVLLLLLDVLHLKTINDRFGYVIGNDVLRTVADALMEATRSTDLVARYGGDEFALLLVDAPPKAVDLVVSRVQEKLTQLVSHRGLALEVRCCIGVAASQEPPEVPDDLLREADRDMYRKKSEPVQPAGDGRT